MSKNIIITTTTAFIAGCFAAHAITVDILYVAYSIPALSATAILLRKNKKATLLCICCIVVLLGYIRIALPSEQTNDLLTEQHGKQVYIEGVIKGDIEDKKTQSRYTVEVNTVDGVPTTKKEMILVYEPYPTRCVSGEAVLLKTTPIEPKDFITKTGRVFGYKKYLQQRNIHAVSYIQKSGCTGKREQFALFERIRKKLVKAMHTFLPTEEATLLGGLLPRTSRTVLRRDVGGISHNRTDTHNSIIRIQCNTSSRSSKTAVSPNITTNKSSSIVTGNSIVCTACRSTNSSGASGKYGNNRTHRPHNTP